MTAMATEVESVGLRNGRFASVVVPGAYAPLRLRSRTLRDVQRRDEGRVFGCGDTSVPSEAECRDSKVWSSHEYVGGDHQRAFLEGHAHASLEHTTLNVAKLGLGQVLTFNLNLGAG